MRSNLHIMRRISIATIFALGSTLFAEVSEQSPKGILSAATTSTAPAVSIISTPSSQPTSQSAKLPIPKTTVQTELEKQIKTRFREEYAQRTRGNAQLLAQKLFDAGVTAKNDAEGYVFLHEASDLSTSNGDLENALKATDEIGKRYDIDVLKMKASIILKMANLENNDSATLVVKSCVSLIEQAVEADEFIAARRMASGGLSAARRLEDKKLISQFTEKDEEIRRIQIEFTRSQKAAGVLQEKPDDPAANLAMGAYQCFFKNNWEGGLPKLLKSSDLVLKAAADQELSSPSTADSRLRLGHLWWSISEDEQNPIKKKACQQRAAHWYKSALPDLVGPEKNQITKRLADVGLPGVHKSEIPKPQMKQAEGQPILPGKEAVIRLSYVSEGWPLGMSVGGRNTKTFTAAPAVQVKNIPKASDGTRYWGELSLGPLGSPNQIPFIIDDARPGDVTMFVDADQNGDFANSPPLKNEGTGVFARVVDLQITYGSKKVPYLIWFFIHDLDLPNKTASFYVRCHQRAQINVANTTYPVILFDEQADGDYSNNPVIIDLNLNGKVEPNEKFTVGSVVHIGNVQLTLKSISPAGDEIRLAPPGSEVGAEQKTQKKIEAKPVSLKDGVLHLSYMNSGFPLGESAIESVVQPYPIEASTTMKNIPKQNGGIRYWGEFRVGPSDKPNRIPYLVDKTSQEPEGLTMYMDCDQDGDFANNPPIRMFDFHHVDIQLVYGSKKMPYRMCFIIRERGNFYYSVCHQWGQLTVGSEGYPVTIFDNPPDGDYSNNLVIIDLNLNGKAEDNEKFKVGDVIRIGNEQATLKSISPAGDEIRFSP